MKRITGLLVAALVLTSTVACGEKSDDATEPKAASTSSGYCKALTPVVDEHFSGTDDELADPVAAFAMLRSAAAKAPKELTADWALLDRTVQDLVSALGQLKITFDDLDAIFMGQAPEGSEVDVDEAMKVLEPVFAAATAPETVAAQERLEEHAKSECGVNFDLGLTPSED